MFGESKSGSHPGHPGSATFGYMIGALALLCSGAIARPPRIAVIGDSGGAPNWCALVRTAGYDCDNLPWTGPEGSLVDYQVVIHLGGWSDPLRTLVDFLREGKAVITHATVPRDLGINTDPIVRAWIGASVFTEDTNQLLTVESDPVLGDLPVGTVLLGFNDALWSALDDTIGHPGAKVLARYRGGTGAIGVMRNDWEGGTSVYYSEPIWPNDPQSKLIIISTVRELAPLPIPTVSHWGLTLSGLLLLTASSIVIHRRRIRIA